MRKIEKTMCLAVSANRSFSCGNTLVTNNDGETRVYLHGNMIYKRNEDGEFFTLAGWNTVTTRSRLRALGVDVSQKNFMPYYNGVMIDSYKWYEK